LETNVSEETLGSEIVKLSGQENFTETRLVSESNTQARQRRAKSLSAKILVNENCILNSSLGNGT